MRVVILGAGAMGSLFGARLAMGGHEVALIDTDAAHMIAVRQHGLFLVQGEREATCRMEAVTWPAEVEPGDFLLLFTKANKAKEALSGMRNLAARSGSIVVLANGIGLGHELTAIVPEVPMLHGATAAGAILEAPGCVRLTVEGITVLGPVEGPTTELAQLLGHALEDAGLPTKVTENVNEFIWTKVLINIAFNAGTALTRLTNGTYAQDAHGQRVIEETIKEALAVAQAAHISIHYENALSHIMELGLGTISPNKSSMLQDVLRERETEIEWLNGAVVREADRLGVPVPINRTLLGLVSMLQGSYAQPASARPASASRHPQKDGRRNET